MYQRKVSYGLDYNMDYIADGANCSLCYFESDYQFECRIPEHNTERLTNKDKNVTLHSQLLISD